MIQRIARTVAFGTVLGIGVADPVAAQLDDVRLEASAETEELSPDAWSGTLHRVRLSAAAAFHRFHVFGSLGTTALAHARTASTRGQYVISGIDTVLNIASAIDPADSIAVAIPAFAPWEGDDDPFDQRGRGSAFARIGYAAAAGWDAAASYDGDRVRRLSRSLANRFNPEAWTAERKGEDRFRLSARVQPGPLAGLGVWLHGDVSHARSLRESGIPAYTWLAGELDPGAGFGFGDVDFLVPDIGTEYDERIARGLRSVLLPLDLTSILPGAYQFHVRQSVPGSTGNLRLNPFGVYAGLPISGVGAAGAVVYTAQRSAESRVALGADWLTDTNALVAGLDWTRHTIDDVRFTLFEARDVLMQRTEPSRWGVHVSDRVVLGPVRLEAGLRFDRIDAGGEHSRVPGFVSVLPDTLLADAYELDPLTGPDDDRTIVERIQRIEDCRGASTCRDNFVATEPQTGWSPRAAIAVDVQPRATVRLGYSAHMHGPGEPPGSPFRAEPGRWTDVIFLNALGDINGWTSPSAPFGRDVRMPRSHLLEASYAHEIGDRVALELSAFRRTVDDAFTFRFEPFVGPLTGRTENLLVLVNRDLAAKDGLAARAHLRLAQMAEVALHYAYREVDEPSASPLLQLGLPSSLPRGPGIDFDEPWAGGFGASSDAALDQHRRHTVAAELSLLTPAGPKLLDDVGMRAALRVASGLPYHRALFNDSVMGPPVSGGGITFDPGARESTPWLDSFELRVHKGVVLTGGRLRLFAHFAGALRGVENRVFLATGTTENPEHRERFLARHLVDSRLDADTDVDGFWVGDCMAERALCEVPASQTAVNAYSLRAAEIRFGDANGFFTVEEQRAAFGAYYDMLHGAQHFTRSDRSLRLGIELLF